MFETVTSAGVCVSLNRILRQSILKNVQLFLLLINSSGSIPLHQS